jgi:hypothetical protein
MTTSRGCGCSAGYYNRVAVGESVLVFGSIRVKQRSEKPRKNYNFQKPHAC